MRVEGIVCPQCKEWIWSRHRHDFRPCKCGRVFVDGGRDYTRYGFLKDGEAKVGSIKVSRRVIK
jgi:hypothetical protein